MFRKALLMLWLALIAFHPIAYGQITATIAGAVKDETGAVLPGVTLTIKNRDTGLTRTLVSNELGRYHASGLDLGNYQVQATLPGFRTEIRTGITLTVGREAVVDFSLKVGEMSEEVTVSGEAPLVETTGSTMGELVDEKKIRDLPLNFRDYTQLILLQPGVVAVRTDQGDILTGKGTKISVAGARPTGNLFLLDGTDVNDAQNRTPGSAQGAMTGVETIKEFKVLSNTYSAEYGKSSGGVFNVVTKSGTNALHGSLFEFHRNDNLDARNFFDPGNKPPEFKRNQFGFAVGGPVRKDRTFFFGSYEALRQSLGITNLLRVPSAQARTTEAARRAGLLGPAESINPQAQRYLDIWPLPNGREITTPDGRPSGVAEFFDVFHQVSKQNFFTVRVDHKLSESDSAFVRYTFDDSELTAPSEGGYSIFSTFGRNRKQYLTLEEKKIFSPQWLNEFRFAFNRNTPGEDINPANPFRELGFFPGKPIGNMEIRGLERFGTDRNLPRKFAQNTFQFIDNLSFFHGRHSLKVGLSIERFQLDGISDSRGRGEFRFLTLRDFLLGRADRFEGLLPGKDDISRAYRQSLFGFYFQDDIKVRPRLTLNLGIRYEFITVPIEANGKETNLRHPLDPAISVGRPLFKNPSLRNYAPRVGFAWDMWGDGKTALRGGFGIFYEQFLFHQYMNSIFRLPPFAVTARVDNPSFPNPRLDRVIIDPAVFAVEFAPGSSYALQYNLNIQREIARETVVIIGYVGSRGVHLSREADHNIANAQVAPDGRFPFFPPNGRPRNPNFTRIRFRTFDANSVYNSMYTSVSKRFSHGAQFQVSYTFSKSIDDKSGGLGRVELGNGQARSSDPFLRTLDRGLSDFDVRHNFVLNYTYDLPFGSRSTGLRGALTRGWQINGIFTASSGVPFTPIITFDIDRDGSDDNEQRPNLRPGWRNNPRLGRPDQWFDPHAFTTPEPGFRGNLGRNTIIGPGLAVFDFSLVKNTSITETKRLQFRAEFFNLFNRPNFDIPARPSLEIFAPVREGREIIGGTLQPGAGRITRTVTTSRQIQFGLKLIF